MYHLRLFGRLELIGPSGVVFAGSSRPLQLLLMASIGRRAKAPTYIAETLWPNCDQERRQHSFRQAIYKLNKLAPTLVTLSPTCVVVNRDIVTTDLDLLAKHEELIDLTVIGEIVRGEFIPDADRAGIGFAQWADGQRAQHWEPFRRRVRGHFRQLISAAAWQQVSKDYRALYPPLSDDPAILAASIRSSIFSGESITLRREISDRIEVLREINRHSADRLARLLERRIRWDRRSKLHVGPFIGRETEIQEFSAMHRSHSDAGFLCCLSGSIGIGKSRTAKQFARIAAIRGSRVRLVQFTFGQPASNHTKVAEALRSLMGPRMRKPPHLATPAQSGSRGFTSPPAVLVLDDLDWGGHACIDLVLGLVAALSETPSLGIIATAKESSLINRLITAAPSGSAVAQFRLQRFNQDERKELFDWLQSRHGLTQDEVKSIDAESAGIPAYAHRFARKARGLSGQIDSVSSGGLAELSRLSPPTLRLFALVSFCGGVVHANALAAALEVTSEDIQRWAGRLIDLGLLESPDHYRYVSSDQFAAHTIQRDIELSELRQLGARVALETATTSKLDAARIANRIGDLDLASRCYFESAREAIGFGSYSDAEALLSRCSTAATDRRLSARADFWQAEIHLRQRQYEEALTMYASLLNSPHLLTLPMLTVAQARHAQVRAMRNPEFADAAFEVAVKLPISRIRMTAPKAVAEVLLATAAIAIVSGNSETMTAIARRIEEELDQVPANTRWLDLAATLCKLRLQVDGFEAVLPLSNRYLMRARLSGVPPELASTILTRAIVLTAAGRLAEAEQLYLEVQDVVSRNRLLGFSHILTSNFAVALLEMGNSDEAISHLTSLRAKDSKVGVSYYLAFDDLNLATAYFERGDTATALMHADEALRRRDAFPNAEFGTALAIVGIAAFREGDTAAATHAMSEIDRTRQRSGDFSYSAMLKALLLQEQVGAQPAVEHLLNAGREADATYRPAAIRLRLCAAETSAAHQQAGAAAIAQDCAEQANLCGMQRVLARAERLVREIAR